MSSSVTSNSPYLRIQDFKKPLESSDKQMFEYISNVAKEILAKKYGELVFNYITHEYVILNASTNKDELQVLLDSVKRIPFDYFPLPERVAVLHAMATKEKDSLKNRVIKFIGHVEPAFTYSKYYTQRIEGNNQTRNISESSDQTTMSSISDSESENENEISDGKKVRFEEDTEKNQDFVI